jgi:hypothetical protein
MIRLIVLFLNVSIFAYGQDSVLVKETCKKINELKTAGNIVAQANIVSGQLMTLGPSIDHIHKENRIKAFYTFQYKLHRELKRTCQNYLIEQVPKVLQRVIDLEDKFTRPEIDSITSLLGDISKTKNIYVYIVTIDDYFPDKNISDFSNRNREFWGQTGSYEKGNVMISVSTSRRQIRVSTSDVSMNYLSDKECDRIIHTITPYFKEAKYFDGILKGLDEMKKSL